MEAYENPPECTLIPDSAQSAKLEDVPVGSAKVFECADECATCSGSAGNCVTCEDNREGAACTCIDGYFEEEVDGVNVCSECSFRCSKCSSLDFCTECAGNRITPETCGCEAGYWDDGVSEDCQECDYNYCIECDTSATDCTVCADGRDGLPDCPCIDGTYDDVTDDVGTCYDCGYKCLTCSESADYCTSCSDENGNRNVGDNACDCEGDRTYDAGIAECQYCNFKCDACVDDSSCTECAGNRLDVDTFCTTCDDGYYDDSVSTDC